MAQVPEVAVAAVNLLPAGGDGDAALLGVIQTVFAGFQRPFAPGGNDFQFGRKRLKGMLEAHLIIALAGTAVGNSRGAFLKRYFHLILGDYRTRQRRSQQILVLIYSSGPQRRENIIGQELLAQVNHRDFRGAGLARLFRDHVNVVALAYVGDHGDDFAIVVLFQPGNNDGGVQPSGICQDHFLTHDCSLRGSGARIHRYRDERLLIRSAHPGLHPATRKPRARLKS